MSRKVPPSKKKKATSVALSDEERAEIAPYAKLRGISVSAYFRELQARDRSRRRAHVKQLLRQQSKKP